MCLNPEDVAVKIAEHQKEIGSLKHRMDACEAQLRVINELACSVDRLAQNMEHMLNEQREQGERLQALETAPMQEMIRCRRQIIGCIITGTISAVIGAFAGLILK